MKLLLTFSSSIAATTDDQKEVNMKKLSLLFVLCMVSMLAFAQNQSPNYLGSRSDEVPPGDVTLAPASWDYGQVAVDFAYDKVFTLTNTRNNSITITGIVASPTPPFSVTHTTCQVTLPGNGGSCFITVQVDARSPGLKSGTLTVDCTGAPACPFTSTLTATAMHDVTLAPTSCNFGEVKVGDQSAPCVITLKNQEPVSLTIDSIVAAPDPPYSILTKTCRSTLLANSSCTITVVFTPEREGAADGTLTVTDNSPDGTPPPVSLSGTGWQCPPEGCCPPTCCPSPQGQASGEIICNPPPTGALLPKGELGPLQGEPLSAYLHPAPGAILNN